MNVIKINHLADVPKLERKYLVFKQSEKEELQRAGFKVSTVHEFQGKQADHISVVRLSNKPQEDIYLSDNHALVALTRHKISMIYYTVVMTDSLSKLIVCPPSIEDLQRATLEPDVSLKQL